MTRDKTTRKEVRDSTFEIFKFFSRFERRHDAAFMSSSIEEALYKDD